MIEEQIMLEHSTGGSFMEGEEVLEYTIEFCQVLKFYKTIMHRKEGTDYNAKLN